MTIHVRRTGSRGSWLVIALLIALTIAALATNYFGLR
jgi:hypothetical protein